ncbi:MAG: hypothetical protein AAB509_01320 [Patescibacteria group bacterium]
MKSDTSKKILGYLVFTGMITIAATSPFFLQRLFKVIFKTDRYNKKTFTNSFNYLRRNKLITIEKNNHDIKIIPTDRGLNVIKKYRVMELKILRPRKWDGKIRIVAFDIPNKQRTQRNAFRYKLKELGFYSAQKSVWLHPFDCRKEIKILADFFGLGEKQISVFTTEKAEGIDLFKKIKTAYKL